MTEANRSKDEQAMRPCPKCGAPVHPENTGFHHCLPSSKTKLDHLIDGIIRDVCELPDYNSPDDQPELLQATCSELEAILRNRLAGETDARLADPKRMRISYETRGRCMWHEDCDKSRSGVMREVLREESRTLLECLSCGRRGYYPVGAVGPVCVAVETAGEQP